MLIIPFIKNSIFYKVEPIFTIFLRIHLHLCEVSAFRLLELNREQVYKWSKYTGRIGSIRIRCFTCSLLFD